eukprot:18254-Heterococcus_DN1.PRE.1
MKPEVSTPLTRYAVRHLCPTNAAAGLSVKPPAAVTSCTDASRAMSSQSKILNTRSHCHSPVAGRAGTSPVTSACTVCRPATKLNAPDRRLLEPLRPWVLVSATASLSTRTL